MGLHGGEGHFGRGELRRLARKHGGRLSTLAVRRVLLGDILRNFVGFWLEIGVRVLDGPLGRLDLRGLLRFLLCL